MDFLQIILNIVVFLISLSVLVCLHEAGHLTAAKIFKVYCYEFSIGMGPAIYQKKPKKEKNQETIFSIRCAPIGGYVAMAGEDLENVEGVDKSIIVPKERTLEAKARWKQVIIMFAGVFMNFVIGYVLLLISYSCCTQAATKLDWTKIQISSNSIISSKQQPENQEFKLETNDTIYSIQIDYYVKDSNNNYTTSTPIHSIPKTEVTSYQLENYNSLSPKQEYNYQISYLLSNNYYVNGKQENYNPTSLKDCREITFGFTKNGGDGTIYYTKVISDAKDDYTQGYQIVGISPAYMYFKYSFGEAFSKAWDRWCYSCSALFISVASLFNPASWSQVGGIISIFKLSSQATTIGFGTYLNFWALISVNLAVMNLLPFPALDGWQILITICEGVYFTCKKWIANIKYKNKKLTSEELEQLKQIDESKSVKKMANYKKFKNIMSYIGMGLLIVLMVVLIIKDIVNPAI